MSLLSDGPHTSELVQEASAIQLDLLSGCS